MIENTVKEEFEKIEDLMEAKKFLTDDLKSRYNTEVSFTLYLEIYNQMPSFRGSVTEENYTQLMMDKYFKVYEKVKEIVENGED